ncbi:hypothetical protein pb186bvf_014151 [Paramecium bursaria]
MILLVMTLKLNLKLFQLGFSWYQIYVFVIVGLIGMCDAGETQAISIVFPILETEWNISGFEESLLGSLVYTGYFVGSLLSGPIADKIGRRKPLVVSSLLMFAVAFVGAFMPNFALYTIFRVILVACIGFIIPVAFSMLTENTPMKLRGIILVTIGIFYTAGELVVCALVYIFMPTLKSGNWRAVLVWASVPAGIVCVISSFLLRESPRFYLIQDKAFNAKKVVENIFEINGKKPQIYDITVYEQMAQELKKQEELEQGGVQEKSKSDIQQSYNQLLKLLKGQFKLITIIVWYQWFVNTFVFAGITFLLPLTLKRLNKEDDTNQNDLGVITLSVLGELPVIFLAIILVNIKGVGRKNSLAFAYLVTGILGVMIVVFQNGDYLFTLMIAGSKMFINLSFTISYQFVSEVYPTYMRASGLGFASSIGRIGSIIMPWIVVYFNDIGTFISYGIFGVLALVAFVGTLILPFDTQQRQLDEAVL